MKLAKKKYEDIIFNSRFSSNLKKKKIYVISGDTLTNSISNEEENSIFTFSNSKNKSTNLIFPYLSSTSRTKSRKYNSVRNENENENNNSKSKTTEFFVYDIQNNLYKNKTINYSNNYFSYKVTNIPKPKLLKTSFSKFLSLIEMKKKKIEEEKKRKERLRKRRTSKYGNQIKDLGLKKILTSIKFAKLLSENVDSVQDLNIQKENWHKTVRKALLNDINAYFKKGKQYKKFYEKFENKINFFYDMCSVPHFKNVLMFKNKSFISNEEIRNNLCNNNCLSKDVLISLHRKKIKILYQEKEEKKIKKKKEEEDELMEFNKNKPNLDKLFQLEDFFIKKIETGIVGFANKKDREYVFNQEINPYYWDN